MIFTSGNRIATRIKVAGERAFQRGLGDEGRPGVEQHREIVPGRIPPEGVEPRLIGAEPGVHRQQLDPAQAEVLVPLLHLRLPSPPGWGRPREIRSRFRDGR